MMHSGERGEPKKSLDKHRFESLPCFKRTCEQQNVEAAVEIAISLQIIAIKDSPHLLRVSVIFVTDVRVGQPAEELFFRRKFCGGLHFFNGGTVFVTKHTFPDQKLFLVGGCKLWNLVEERKSVVGGA